MMEQMDLGQALTEHYIEGAAKRAQGRGPAARNQASAVGWPCPSGPRYLVLLRTVQPEQTTPGLQMIFEEGDAQEEIIARQLVRDGWGVMESEHPNKVWGDLQISGRIDREVTIPKDIAEQFGLDPRKRYVAEFKTMAAPSFEKCTSVGAMLYAHQPWLRAYPVQLGLYLWLESRDTGLFVLKCKATNEFRFLLLKLDDTIGLIADAVEQCKQANAHIAAGTLPPVTGYEDAVCRRCRVRNSCLPGEAGVGAEVILNEEMEEALRRREELAPATKEYEALDSYVKAQTKALAGTRDGVWIAADWELRVTHRTQQRKAQEARELTVTTVGIRRMMDTSEEADSE